MDKKYQNLDKIYVCDNCNTQIETPMHCGHPMHLENNNNVVQWVCWMGVKCGSKEYTPCCENSSIPILVSLGY